jgi:magnesium chelatase subunit H
MCLASVILDLSIINLQSLTKSTYDNEASKLAPRTENAFRHLLQGYDLGPDVPEDLTGSGEAIIKTLLALDQSGVIARGPSALRQVPATVGNAVMATMSPRDLRKRLKFDTAWGPDEWGPIPFLPPDDLLVKNMESAWGDLYNYRGLSTSARGELLVSGVQVCFPYH